MTHCVMKLRIMRFIETPSINNSRYNTQYVVCGDGMLSVNILCVTFLNCCDECCYAECRHAECHGAVKREFRHEVLMHSLPPPHTHTHTHTHSSIHTHTESAIKSESERLYNDEEQFLNILHHFLFSKMVIVSMHFSSLPYSIHYFISYLIFYP